MKKILEKYKLTELLNKRNKIKVLIKASTFGEVEMQMKCNRVFDKEARCLEQK